MKKVMLYLSLVMSGFYAVAVCLVIVLQDAIRRASGFQEKEMSFLLPVDIAVCIVMLVITVAFSILLLKSVQDVRANIEMTVLIIFSILIVLMPWICTLLFTVQCNYYNFSMGVSGLAAYNILHSSMIGLDPFLVFAMLLLVIHSGISLGKKGR